MKLNHIRDVVAIAQRGGFRAAAKFLGTQQAALSRSIAELERELQVPLFERHGRGVSLTDFGKRFVEHANTALAEMQHAREAIEQMRGMGTGSVSACMSSTSQARLLPTLVRTFRSRYPAITLRVRTGPYQRAVQAMREGRVDLYVGPKPAAGVEPNMAQECLYRNRLVVLARSGHPLAGARSLAALRDADWMGARLDNEIEDLPVVFRRCGLEPPSIGFEFETAWTMLSMSAHTDMLALLPEESADLLVAAGNMVRIDVQEVLEGPPTVLVWRRDLPLTPAADCFCDLLRRAATWARDAA